MARTSVFFSRPLRRASSCWTIIESSVSRTRAINLPVHRAFHAKCAYPPTVPLLSWTSSMISAAAIGAAGLALSAMSNSVLHADTDFINQEDTYELTNWSATHTVATRTFFEPETIDELECLLASAHAQGRRLRVVGSALSPNGMGLSNDGMVSIANLSDVVEVDPKKKTITVQAGARVADVVAALRPYGLTLANYASINEQQMGGFIQVGAHGTGAAIPPVDEQVIALDLVTPAQGTLHLSLADADPSLFLMARQALGALGVVSQVTLQCVPLHRLTERTSVVSRAEAVASHDMRLRNNRHVRYMWIPHEDAVVVVECNPTVEGDVCTDVAPDFALAPLRKLLRSYRPAISEAQLEQLNFADLRDEILVAGPTDVNLVKACNAAEAEFWRRSQGVTKIDTSDRVLGFECGGQQWVNEVAMPAGTLESLSGRDMDYMKRLLALIEAENIAAPSPIEQRWTAGSRSRMSLTPSQTSQNNDSADTMVYSWVGIIMYLCSQDTAVRDRITAAFEHYVSLRSDRLDDEFGAFVHWAKLEPPADAEAARTLRDRLAQRVSLQEFERIRQLLDPKGVMGNTWLQQVFSN